jgi:NADH-quinone oxidoreductase subunit K
MELSFGLMDFLILAAILFTVAVTGLFINRKSVINILLAVELMLLAVNINFVAFSVYLNDIAGQIFTIFVLTIAAAEAAIGLAILVVYYRNKGNIDIEEVSQLKG